MYSCGFRDRKPRNGQKRYRYIDLPFLYIPGFAIYAVGDFDNVQVLCYFDKNTCPCRRGFEVRTGTVRKHVYAVGDFDYVHVHVLSDPCRRGFRPRTGTDVQARKKKKSFFLPCFSLPRLYYISLVRPCVGGPLGRPRGSD